MIDGIVTIFALGVAGFLLLYLAFSLDKEHFLLKILLIFFLISGVLQYIPKVALDTTASCEILPLNATTNSSGFTHYDYGKVCFPNAAGTQTSFFESMLWLNRLFILYIVLFVMWMFFGEKIVAWVGRYKRGGR